MVHAIAPRPAEQAVDLVELTVVPGQDVAVGNTIASIKADKAVGDVAAPVGGTRPAKLP